MATAEPLQVEVTLGNRHALATAVQHLPVAATRFENGSVLVQLGSTEAWLSADAAAKLGAVLLSSTVDAGKHDDPDEPRIGGVAL